LKTEISRTKALDKIQFLQKMQKTRREIVKKEQREGDIRLKGKQFGLTPKKKNPHSEGSGLRRVGSKYLFLFLNATHLSLSRIRNAHPVGLLVQAGQSPLYMIHSQPDVCFTLNITIF
jgi:hypothetical protein